MWVAYLCKRGCVISLHQSRVDSIRNGHARLQRREPLRTPAARPQSTSAPNIKCCTLRIRPRGVRIRRVYISVAVQPTLPAFRGIILRPHFGVIVLMSALCISLNQGRHRPRQSLTNNTYIAPQAAAALLCHGQSGRTAYRPKAKLAPTNFDLQPYTQP